ncbi:hypothetical protein [Tenacibaculum retecalamus]|nr:hypothetical protein [Tenacibaculum retecalamus]WBX70682.1 hypothetical protein PG912_10575 [Tenacibaculum retecalamus]
MFRIPYGASSSVNSGEEADLNNPSGMIITVVAQDGIAKTDWKIIPSID